jgi:hypothetical protein
MRAKRGFLILGAARTTPASHALDLTVFVIERPLAAHWFIAFSASPHFHWNPAWSDPPPSRP